MNCRSKLSLITFVFILLTAFVVSHPLSESVKGYHLPTLFQQKIYSKKSNVNTEEKSNVPDASILNDDKSSTKKNKFSETQSTNDVMKIDSITTLKIKDTTTEYITDYADNDDDDNLSSACIAALCSGK